MRDRRDRQRADGVAEVSAQTHAGRDLFSCAGRSNRIRSEPLVSVALYDIVEEESARSNHVEDIRDDTGRVVARQERAASFRPLVSAQRGRCGCRDRASTSRSHPQGRSRHRFVARRRITRRSARRRSFGATADRETAAPARTTPRAIASATPGWRTTLDLTLVVPVLPAPSPRSRHRQRSSTSASARDAATATLRRWTPTPAIAAARSPSRSDDAIASD